MSNSPLSSMDAGEGLDIMFDNNSDAECTVVTVEGKDKAHLLMSLTGGFSSAGLTVISASITSDDGRVLDVFRVQTADGKKVRYSARRACLGNWIMRLCQGRAASRVCNMSRHGPSGIRLPQTCWPC